MDGVEGEECVGHTRCGGDDGARKGIAPMSMDMVEVCGNL